MSSCGTIFDTTPLLPWRPAILSPGWILRFTATKTLTIFITPGVSGTIVEVRVFSRRGVDKDERALAIERAEIERLAKDRDDEQAILDRNVYGRLAELLEGRQGIAGPKGFKKDSKITRSVLEEYPRSQWWQFASPNDKLMAEIEAIRK